MNKEVFERNLDLAQLTIRDLFPQIGEVLEETIGVKGLGYIPIKIPLEVLERKAKELGYHFGTIFGGGTRRVSQALMVVGIKENNGYPIAIYKIDGGWWVTNSDFDEFCEAFAKER